MPNPSTSVACAAFPVAIASAVSVPNPSASVACVVSPAGIASARAVPVPATAVACAVFPIAVGSAEHFGSVVVAGTEPTELPPDLLAAIQATIHAGGIGSQFTGGVWSIKADDGAAAPFLVIRQRSSTIELRTSDCDVAAVTIETRAYAPTTDQAGELDDALRPILRGSRNPFLDAAVSPLIPEGDPRSATEPGRGKGAVEVRYNEQLDQGGVIRASPAL